MIETSQSVFAALADPLRRELIISLADSPSTATQFAREYPITRQGILKHLDILENAGLVATRRRGREVQYELRNEPLANVDEFVKRVGAKLDKRLGRLKTMLENE